MGLFDKLFNDDDKAAEEEAKRKAAEKYAEDHAKTHAAGTEHAEHAETHAAAHPAAHTAHAETHAPAHVEAPAAAAAAPAKKAAAKPAAAKKTAAKAEPAAAAPIPHQLVPASAAGAAAASSTAAIHQAGHAQAGAVTVAHDQAMTLHILSHIPDHAPREGDPHYHLFEQAKARLKRQGMWKCMINDDLCLGGPELHHTFIEFSQINEVDEAKVQQALGLHFANDEEFQAWAESPGNLEVLCANHHRAHYGIHVIPGPLWEALRFRKANTAAAAEFVSAGDVKKNEAAAADGSD